MLFGFRGKYRISGGETEATDLLVQLRKELTLSGLADLSTVTQSQRSMRVEWELKTSDVTLKADIRAVRGASPLFGVERSGGSAVLLQPVRAKGVSAPSRIALNDRTCAAVP
jgi:hypothetical protein